MHINSSKIKDSVENLLKNNGVIRKIYDNDLNPIGFIIRKELENTDENASVLFNISFNYELYNKNSKKSFTLNEYKYFAIQRIEKINKTNFLDFNKTEGHVILNYNDKEISEIMNEKLFDYINWYVDYVAYDISKNNENNIYSLKNVKYIFNIVKNVEKYYKNKKINVYFTINF